MELTSQKHRGITAMVWEEQRARDYRWRLQASHVLDRLQPSVVSSFLVHALHSPTQPVPIRARAISDSDTPMSPISSNSWPWLGATVPRPRPTHPLSLDFWAKQGIFQQDATEVLRRTALQRGGPLWQWMLDKIFCASGPALGPRKKEFKVVAYSRDGWHPLQDIEAELLGSGAPSE